ncbi:hypothetical protein [Komagataeibacter xylinus]|uniref:Uncharacterized protein n=1 Tax=Komagataeibacter xylinus TaxID=28448 RepID=A0A857FS08_KOMXY|nr:hypothetical protein [Komagataeibacter xylinus]QHC35244.1 hypothetical protein FMA36_06790 [Komagataeibacter xylinus]
MTQFSNPSPTRRLLVIVLVAATGGILFGSEPILAWTEQLSPTMPYQTELQSVADRWNTLAARLKMTVPYNTIRALERQIESYRFAPAPDQ